MHRIVSMQAKLIWGTESIRRAHTLSLCFCGIWGSLFFSFWNFHFGVRELLILLSQLYVLFSIVILICC